MKDRYGREISCMRISVTDRCNLRCCYCMPEGMAAGGLPAAELMTCAEICEVAEAAVSLGITKFRITGGEPLVRADVADIIRELKHLPGVEEIALTTNGILLQEQLGSLIESGLDRVNVSLDTLDPERFRRMTGTDGLERVRAGIRACLEAGLPVKINAVLLEKVNADEWRRLALLARELPVRVRFIELMPIGAGAACRGAAGEDTRRAFLAAYPDAREVTGRCGSGPARYLHVPGWQGDVGFIPAAHRKICKSCSRLRLTAAGRIKPCLCYESSVDLMDIFRLYGEDRSLRAGLLRERIREAVCMKPAGNCFEEPAGVTEKRLMVQIGG